MIFSFKSFKNNKNYYIALLISSIVAFFCIIYFIYNLNYHSFENTKNYSDKENFNLITEELTKINSSVSECLSNGTINTKKCLVTLPTMIDKLNTCNTTASDLTLKNDSNNLVKITLSSAINSTLDLYSYCSLCLTSTDKASINDITETLEDLKSECIKNYNALSSYGFSLSYTSEMDNFLTSLIRYLSKLNKLTIDKEMTSTNIAAFKKTLNSSANDLSKILEDLQPAVLKIRDDNRSLDVLLDDLSTKEQRFNDIKTNFSYISIPEGYLSYYSSLTDTFNLYSKYLTAMRIAIIYEKSSASYDSNKAAIDKNYENAYAKYDDVVDSLNSVLKSIKSL